MWDMWTTLATNNGVSFSGGVCLIAFVLGIIFYAKGFKIGGAINMVIFGAIFVWFYEESPQLNWTLPLTIFFIHIATLAIGMYAENKTTLGEVA